MNTLNPAPVTTTAEDAQEVAAVRAPVAVATSDEEKRKVVGRYFDDEWAVNSTMNLLHDYHQLVTDQGGRMKADLNHGAWLERVAFFAACVYNHPDFDETPGFFGRVAREIEEEANTLRGLLAAPTLMGVADGDAESVEPEFCPRCDGEGTENVMSDGGPDAYEVEVECSHCRGNQTLRAAYNGVLDALRREEDKYRECAAILYLGHANPTAAKRIAEIAEYLKKPGAQLDWAHDRLMALADMAKTSGDAVGGKSGGAQQEAMPGDEAAEIIGDLIAGIEKHGMYSKESTLMSLTQAYYSLRPENPPLASREQEIELTLARRIDEIAALFGSLREAASVLEIDAGYLSRLRSGEKSEPSGDVLKKLGLKRKLSYVHTRRQYAASPLIPRTRSA